MCKAWPAATWFIENSCVDSLASVSAEDKCVHLPNRIVLIFGRWKRKMVRNRKAKLITWSRLASSLPCIIQKDNQQEKIYCTTTWLLLSFSSSRSADRLLLKPIHSPPLILALALHISLQRHMTSPPNFSCLAILTRYLWLKIIHRVSSPTDLLNISGSSRKGRATTERRWVGRQNSACWEGDSILGKYPRAMLREPKSWSEKTYLQRKEAISKTVVRSSLQ